MVNRQVILTTYMADKIYLTYSRILHQDRSGRQFNHSSSTAKFFMEDFSILPVQIWIYLMVLSDFGLRRRTVFDTIEHHEQGKIPLSFDSKFVKWKTRIVRSMEKSREIKSSILFLMFYLCHTFNSELFLVFDHFELDKNWTNKRPEFQN